MRLAAIAAGGALGALARYGAGLLVPATARGFPWPTFAVNISGSFIAGLLVAVFSARSSSDVISFGLIVGFLGAYTTFSAFAVQTEELLSNRLGALALAYVAASVVVGLAAAWAGVRLGRAIA